MSSSYPRPPAGEPGGAARFNRMDRLMLVLLLVVAGLFLLMLLSSQWRS